MKYITLIILGFSFQLQANDLCEEAKLDRDRCLEEKNHIQDELHQLNREISKLSEILRSRDFDYELQRCSDDLRDLNRQVRKAERDLIPLKEQNRQLKRELSQETRALTRHLRNKVQVECIVVDKKYGESGVGIGSRRDEAISDAKANVRLDEILYKERLLANTDNQAEKAKLQREIQHMRNAKETVYKNGIHSFCYDVYPNSPSKLTRGVIEAGPNNQPRVSEPPPSRERGENRRGPRPPRRARG